MKKIITDLWYRSASEDLINIYIEDQNGNEYELAQLEWLGHEGIDQEFIYNECLQIANEMGYWLEGQKEYEEKSMVECN